MHQTIQQIKMRRKMMKGSDKILFVLYIKIDIILSKSYEFFIVCSV